MVSSLILPIYLINFFSLLLLVLAKCNKTQTSFQYASLYRFILAEPSNTMLDTTFCLTESDMQLNGVTLEQKFLQKVQNSSYSLSTLHLKIMFVQAFHLISKQSNNKHFCKMCNFYFTTTSHFVTIQFAYKLIYQEKILKYKKDRIVFEFQSSDELHY